MSNNNLTDERLSALIRVARDSLELYEMELPVIDDVMLALAELQQRRAAMLQGAESSESRCTIQPAPELDSLPKNDESRCSSNQGAEPVSQPYTLPFDQWLSQQSGKIDVDCGCVTTEAFFHWLRLAYEAGNSSAIPDGWTGRDKANAALIMLDRIDTLDPVDDDRIEGIKRIIRELAAAPKQEAE